MTRRLLTNVVVALFLGATLGATQSSSPLADAARAATAAQIASAMTPSRLNCPAG
jgi:hypothetical protein